MKKFQFIFNTIFFLPQFRSGEQGFFVKRRWMGVDTMVLSSTASFAFIFTLFHIYTLHYILFFCYTDLAYNIFVSQHVLLLLFISLEKKLQKWGNP